MRAWLFYEPSFCSHISQHDTTTANVNAQNAGGGLHRRTQTLRTVNRTLHQLSKSARQRARTITSAMDSTGLPTLKMVDGAGWEDLGLVEGTTAVSPASLTTTLTGTVKVMIVTSVHTYILHTHFGIPEKLTTKRISRYNKSGLISNDSEEISSENAENCFSRSRKPNCHLTPSPREIPANIQISVVSPKSRIIGDISAADCMGLSSFNFF